MRSERKAFLVALLLICGCGQDNDSRWNLISGAIEKYATSNNGQMMDNRLPLSAQPTSVRCWTLVFPIDDLTGTTVDMFANGLSTALTKAENALAGSLSSSSDPTVYESEPGKFTWAHGPALVRELSGGGRGGSFHIRARGLAQDANGLSGYPHVVKEDSSPQGKKIVLLEITVARAK